MMSSIGACLSALREGRLLALPTDTYYALACDPLNSAAMSRLRALKRPSAHRPWPLLVDRQVDLAALGCVVTELARRLICAFWPGQVTVVVPCSGALSLAVGRKGDGAVGFRSPAGPPFLAELLHTWRGPITGTSANLSGQAPATTPADFDPSLGEAVACVVTAVCPGGAASTVVDATGTVTGIIREGVVPASEIIGVLS